MQLFTDTWRHRTCIRLHLVLAECKSCRSSAISCCSWCACLCSVEIGLESGSGNESQRNFAPTVQIGKSAVSLFSVRTRHGETVTACVHTFECTFDCPQAPILHRLDTYKNCNIQPGRELGWYPHLPKSAHHLFLCFLWLSIFLSLSHELKLQLLNLLPWCRTLRLV